jgi:sialate O-acetylesterase
LVLTCSYLHAAVSLASPFTDHAVLQRERPVPVWGMATVGERITVTCQGVTATTITDSKGRWSVVLAPLPVGGPYQMVVSGSTTIALKDILVGDVWLCSGQSNMAFTVKQVDHGISEIAQANHPQMRLFQVARKAADAPLATCAGAWNRCSPATIERFSAVAYYFGRELHSALSVPIGLIDASWGGTMAEPWTTQQGLESSPEFKNVFAEWDKILKAYPKAMETYRTVTLPAWERASAEAKAAGKTAARKPFEPSGPNTLERRPAGLYNGMIAPLVPYALRGAIWYQGEANAKPVQDEAYRRLLPLMITSWRTAFGHDLSFYIVQLANYGVNDEKLATAPWPVVSWPLVREGQAITAATLPECGLAVTIDIGNPKDIHPTNKREVGRRLALSALAKDYGRTLEYSGPVFSGMTLQGGTAVLAFDHADGLAAAKGELRGFTLAGSDGRFLAARAEIQGPTVRVSCAGVQVPVAVRYSWANSPDGNLINKAGLPASPFRHPQK